MTPDQCRKAREQLGWSVSHLSAVSGVGQNTICYAEAGRGRSRARTLAAIRIALEAAGVEFIVETVGGPGVRLRELTA